MEGIRALPRIEIAAKISLRSLVKSGDSACLCGHIHGNFISSVHSRGSAAQLGRGVLAAQ